MQHQRQPLAVLVLVVLLSGLFSGSIMAQTDARMPVLIDTDIGTEIDDTFALGLAFGSQELEVRGLTTSGHEAQKKAMMLCRFLTVTGRRHVRIAVGANPQPLRPITDLSKYYYHPDALFNRTTKPEEQSAAEFLSGRLKEQPGKTTLVALGPLTNLARLIEEHPESTAMVGRVILLESNLALDVAAAQKVFAAKLPLVVISSEASKDLWLDDAAVKEVFRPGTALTRQVQAMYQMWDRTRPPLGESLAVAMGFDSRFVTLDEQTLVVDDQGQLQESKDGTKVHVAASVKTEEFGDWYKRRMASLLPPHKRPTQAINPGMMPHRVHVAEDFDTDIERFWWMSGKPETQLLPPQSLRACRGVLTHDFDDLLMASREMFSAVIFNPVPGPPMGKNTRLSFRYWLKGTDTLRIQIYSLSHGYHRHLVVNGLAQEEWQHAAVDMTKARRPDGTGGALSEQERIDDIQFYADPDAEIVIDDIVLYDAAPKDENQPFPKRILFTGIFDTGKQGEHWPGQFEIVPDAGNFWKAVVSVQKPKTNQPWLSIGLRGERTLADKTQLSFRYLLSGTDCVQVRLSNSKTGKSQMRDAKNLKTESWAKATIDFETEALPSVDEIQFVLPQGAKLLIDDLLLYEPGLKS